MSNLGWPEIPEIPVEFKSCDGNMVAHVVVDLGILGEWEVGDVRADEATFKEFTPEEIEDVKAEIQHAFNRLLMRIAASALVKRGEGCFPVIGWYAHALVEEHGEEKANEMIDRDIAELLKYRKDGVGFHEL